MKILQTSQRQIGQVYVPAINRGLFAAVVLLVVGFGSSTALAAAYGVAVTGTFMLNTVLFLALARLLWHQPRRLIALGAIVFLGIELAFFAANLTKIVHGGWVPLVIALVAFVVLVTWRKGREIVSANRSREEGPLRDFVKRLDARDFPVVRVPGTAVFLNSNPNTTPLALRANVEHNHVLHKNVVIVSIETERVPHIAEPDRLRPNSVGEGGDGLTRLTARFGFKDDTDVPATLRLAKRLELFEGTCDLDTASYFLSQITIVRSDTPGMSRWRKSLFLTLAHNAADPVEYFRLPEHRTLTIGERIEL